MPVYLEKSILGLDTIYLNGGKRGFLVSLDPRHLVTLLAPVEVAVALER
jgi:prolyl-tRNA editing enzyme YbaK/EbsC (Cys-tRNA(Pro) deacylase)